MKVRRNGEWTGKQRRMIHRKEYRKEFATRGLLKSGERRCTQTVLAIQELGKEASCFVATGMDFTEIWGSHLDTTRECRCRVRYVSTFFHVGLTKKEEPDGPGVTRVPGKIEVLYATFARWKLHGKDVELHVQSPG